MSWGETVAAALRGDGVRPRPTVLLNPGPVNVDERVRRALVHPDICHREVEFSDLMTRAREKASEACGGDERYTSVLFTGSGTSSLEATISSIVPADGRVLIIENGHYGERLAAITSAHGISHERLTSDWGSQIDLDRLDETLARDLAVTHVGLVHHETSTGMLNPLHEVGEIVAGHHRSLIVDAVSSVGGELLDVRSDHVDWCVGTANKCIEGLPGVSFVCARHDMLEELGAVRSRTFYLDLHRQYVAEHRELSPPFTPAIQVCNAFDIALDLLLEETVASRFARYSALAGRLRSGLLECGVELLLPPEHRASTVTAAWLGDRVAYGPLHDALKSEGFVVYAGQGTFGRSMFRVANMGQVTAEDIDRFLDSLGRVLQRLR